MNRMHRFVSSLILGLLLTSVVSCGSDGTSGEPGAIIPVGATVTLAWDPPQDPAIYGHYVHYGSQSPGQPGSCSYEHSQYVSSNSATILGLDFDTRYYFAVSAFNGVEGLCSDEVSTVTASA
jgi:hypothetical protein